MSPAKQRELFGALDLTLVALKPIADAVAAGDYPKAEHELAEYYRHRTSPAWQFAAPKNPGAKDPIAEAAVEGRVKGDNVPPWHIFPDNKIDWLYNPTYVTPGLTPNRSWQEFLCRMDFWANLGDAYRATKDERYTDAWIKQFHSFITECPPPGSPDFKPLKINPIEVKYGGTTNQAVSWWRINVALRMMHPWPEAFFSFLPSSKFTDEDVALYLDSCLAHVRGLISDKNGMGNIFTMEMGGLYTVGAYFPEFKDARSWCDFAVKRMYDVENTEYLPDGAEYELSTMYHNTSLGNVTTLADIARRVGRLNELPDGYIAGLKRAYDFDLHIMTPDRKFPEFNDSAAYHLFGQFSKALEYFPDDQEFQWAASDGAKGHPPTETSHAFSYAGFYVMRSGWEKDANYCVLRAGPLGESHQHQDKLNVIFWPYGREVLFNSGGATYEISKWRTYSTSTFSKNTVLADGKEQERDARHYQSFFSKAPIDARWESTADHDFAAGVYNDGYGSLDNRPATHTRRVLFVKPDLVIIADTLVPNDGNEHTYQARWNLLTTQTTQNPVTHATTTTDKNKPNLALLPLQLDHLEVSSASAQEVPELLGWNIRHDASLPHMPATTVLHMKKGAGTQSFLTLLVPMRAGSASPIKSVQPQAPDSATVIFNDGRSLSIVTDPDPKGGIEVVETLPNRGAGRHVKVAAATGLRNTEGINIFSGKVYAASEPMTDK